MRRWLLPIDLWIHTLVIRRPRQQVNRERIHRIERVKVLVLPLVLHSMERVAQHLLCLICLGSHT